MKKFCTKVTRFFVMPVCLKSAFIAKPLYIRIHNYGFRFVIDVSKLCNFFKFLSFKIKELLSFLGYFFAIFEWHWAIWKPIGKPFGTKLFFGPMSVLNTKISSLIRKLALIDLNSLELPPVSWRWTIDQKQDGRRKCCWAVGGFISHAEYWHIQYLRSFFNNQYLRNFF